MSLEMPMPSIIDTSDSQLDNNLKETLTINENNEFTENSDIPPSNKSCMHDAKVTPGEEIGEISLIETPIDEEKVADTDNIYEQNKELPDNVPISVLNEIKKSEQTTTRSDEAAAVIESEDNNSCTSIENKPEVKEIEESRVILETKTLLEEEKAADTTNNVTDDIIEQNNVLPDKFPIVVDKSSKQTTTESGETVNINAGNNSSSILSVFNELEVQSLEEIEELPKIKTDVKEKKTGGTTHVTGNISEQNKISSNKLPLITVDDNNSNKQTTTESNEAPINNAGGNISTSSSIENKPEVKQFERIEELPNVETPIEDGKSTDIINNVISDINEQSKILPDKLQITVEGDIKINKQRIPGSDEASLINNKANISTSSVVNEREVNSMEEIEVNLMTDTLIEEKNSSNATKNNDTCDTIGINKIILPDKLPITVEDDVKSNKQIKPKNDQVPVINSGDNESSISEIETKPELQAVEEIKVLSHADITTNEEKVSDCSINVIDNIEEQNKELPDKVPITVVDDIKNNEQTILRSDEAAVISSGDNNSSNSLIENKPEVKPVEDMGVIITKTETLVEEEIVADNTNNVTDVINEQNKVLPDKLTTFAVDGNINNKQTTSDSGDALDTNYGDNSSVLNEPEVKSPEEIEEIPKTETCIEEEKVDDSTNNVTGNINEQNQILSDKLPLTAMDDNTSCKQTSGSDEIPEINIDDNNSTISKQSRKRQKKTSVPDDYEESQEVSPPKKEAKTIDMLNSSNELLSQDTNKLPPQDSEPPTKVTKSPAVKEVPAPVRVSARQKQRQAAAAAALAAEEKAKTTKSSPESFSKKVVIQEKSGDKRVKKSLSPTKELQIKISSSKPEVSKQSPIVSQKSPKDIDTKQSPQFSPKKMLKQLGQDKLEPITLKLSKEENPVIVRSSSLSPKKVLSPLSPQTKTLGYTLKINKDSTKIVPKDSAVSPNTRDASPSSSNTKADLSGKVGYLIKDTGLTITPIAPAETQDQKLSKITLKLSKAGGHPEIKQEKSETWKAIQKLGEIDIVPVEGKPSPENSKRKEKPDQESPEKKIKLGEVTVEPASSGMSKLQGLLTQAPLNQSDDSEDIQFVGFSPSPEKVQPTQQLTYDLGLVKQETEPVLQKKRGRPRKIITPPEIGHSVGQSIPSGLSAKDILAASLQHQTLQQHIQHLQSPVSIIPSEEQECSSTMFPVPLFDLSEDTFMDPTPPTVFPEQVQPQTILRSARGRPIGRSRRSRGSGLLRTSERGGPRGRPRGSRGIKRMLEEMEALSYQDVDEHITLDNIDSEIGPRIPEHSGSQITEKTIALLRKSIEGKREGIEKRARKSDSGDDKNRDSDIDAQVREMKEKIEAAYQAELKFPGKEGKKKTPEKGEGREKKGPPELIPLQKGNTPDKKVKVSSEDVSFRKISTDGTSDSFHGVGKESLKRKLDEENTEHTFENIKRKSTEDSINESNQQGSSQDQSETENLTTEDNSLKESLKESEDGDTMDVDQPVSPEEPEQVVEVKSEPEPPPKPVKPRPKSKAEIKRIKREKDRIRREAKKLAALEALKLAPPPNPFEEDTRMSATDPNGEGIDDPLGSGIKKNRMEVGDPEGKEFTVDQIAEYQWPLQGGELYMIQEQISTYLGVKSFKRKYPDLKRRPVEMEERTFLCDSGLVSESMCDLGLTAVSSSEVLDIMFQDFQEQYEELRKHMREKQARELINKQKGIKRKKFELSLSKSDLKEQAIQSAVSWNSQLNRSRSESRRCHLDLQTWTIQYPRSRGSKMTRPTPRLGNYPVALIPGQYADFYKRYTAQELRYWPVNTVLYGPLQPNERHSTGGSDGSQSEMTARVMEKGREPVKRRKKDAKPVGERGVVRRSYSAPSAATTVPQLLCGLEESAPRLLDLQSVLITGMLKVTELTLITVSNYFNNSCVHSHHRAQA
ncbi:LOW QUALITY PROTEIN: titin [Homalodisca vitripennis]|uniref:LOW QUALITY PROTEIN: titin n=1 Tax=Homalodisca vitripennis TaxID=197043 RepID=UPI001EEB0437|nr:LOW QUALITY PROTEIN: titin [Homalodisca vitripennis]